MNKAPILITGVGRRLGLNLPHRFLQKSIPVIGTYRTHRASIKELENKVAQLFQSDFTEHKQVQKLIESIKQSNTALRAIIYNASDWLADENTLSHPQMLDRMMRFHVSIPYQLNLALEPLMHSSKDKATDIIHIGDYVSSRGSTKYIAYAASKAAQYNLTLSFASKLAPRVKVNSTAPALVIFNEHDDEAYRHKARNKSLIKREAGLTEFENTVEYLLQSDYVTGRILALDGGRPLC